MRVMKFLFKMLTTLLLIGTLSGCMFGWLFYRYITDTVMPSEKVKINLETMPVNLSSRLYRKDESTGEWMEWYILQNGENREWAGYEEIPNSFKNAFVAIEDERFWTHPGIDAKRTLAAGLNFVTGRTVFGGSTITQQLVKNLSGDDEVTINRKITEICRAIRLEQTYSKEQILEWYLNIIYFGRGQYGISAAAQYYFEKELDELTLLETCSITGITNNPSRYDPYEHPENNKKRAYLILDKMLDLGFISEREHAAARACKLVLVEHSKNQKSGTVIYPWYVDAVIEDVIACFEEDFGVSREQATKMLYYGGYDIYTCIDMRIQSAMDSVYRDASNIPETRDGKPLQSAMTVIDPYTGDIVGMCGGVGEKSVSRGLNWASGRLARRPPGSSIKPIAVYAPAMDRNLINPWTWFMDDEYVRLSSTDWMPKNDNRKYSGPVTVHDAVVKSLNTVSAQVMDLLTPEESYGFLTKNLKMGLEPEDEAYAPLAAGQLSVGTTVREMASAYTIFPGNGIYRQGRTFERINGPDGSTVCENKPVTGLALEKNTALWMTSILQDAVSYGTGTGARLDRMPAAGKTGTTSDAKDRWFVGYTPYYVGAVWTGYESPSPMHVSGNPAAKIWKQVMEHVHKQLPIIQFEEPDKSDVPGPAQKLPTPDGGVVYDDSQTIPDGNLPADEWWQDIWDTEGNTGQEPWKPEEETPWEPEEETPVEPGEDDSIIIIQPEPGSNMDPEPPAEPEPPVQPPPPTGQIIDPWTMQPIN